MMEGNIRNLVAFHQDVLARFLELFFGKRREKFAGQDTVKPGKLLRTSAAVTGTAGVSF